MLTIDGEIYLKEKELSNKYGLTIHWLRRARYTKKTPPYYKFNGKIYYKDISVNEWLKCNFKSC